MPTITTYELNESELSHLSILRFPNANKDWLQYVVENRKGYYKGKKFDIVIGPVANDNTMSVINNYMAGTIDENTALILLKPQKLSDQYVFLTYNGLQMLKLKEVSQYDE